MANEFTLADYEALAPDNLTKGVIRTWREASPILDMLPLTEDAHLTQKVLRYNSLPTVPWRKIGETFTDVKINPDTLEERLFFMGAKIDVPYEYVKAPSISNPRADQEEAVMKASAYAFNEAFFVNTPTADEDAPIGLWYRLVNELASGQSYDANGIDISPNTGTSNVWNDFFDVLGEVLDRVEGPDSDKVLFMGRTVYMRAQALMRRSQLLNTTQDNLGRTFLTYGQGGPKLVQAGYKVDQSTQILPDTETAAGTALTTGTLSSIFCVRFGAPYLAGWTQERPNAEDVGLIEARTHYRTVVRGSVGLHQSHPRAIARAFNIQAA